MRRSAAPSQQGLAPKRPRFNPPFRSNNTVPLNTPLALPSQHTTHSASQSLPRTQQPAHGNVANINKNKERSAEAVESVSSIQLVDAKESNDKQESRDHAENASCSTVAKLESDGTDIGEGQGHGQTDIHELGSTDAGHLTHDMHGSALAGESSTGTRPQHLLHKSSLMQRKPFMVKQTTPAVKPPRKEIEDDDGPKRHYYSVMWCKLSKKKHKKWEGDALLITKGRSVTLLDVEGKEIGKGSGYRPSELESMEEGHTLCVGGKEIEVRYQSNLSLALGVKCCCLLL
ncbi:DNA repair and recombination protein RAD54B-like [Lytechinus variegatus]|uniref:DNA repair and recombination protein RAD54B-like n=1 Tax=Lytechinus variegatus TaxID=7654 RepID=UPI001BB1E31B|nr:DNA repair and recombination protein RAD54B-like [Lytechinus variegatus]XP_041456751.1 DNA repair and recombination protein RAD54B-like [Lytechinus variegatus]